MYQKKWTFFLKMENRWGNFDHSIKQVSLSLGVNTFYFSKVSCLKP